MSYKTNPTVNRVKHTLGWQPIISSTLPQNARFIENSINYRNFIFFKAWLKLRGWILLSFEQNIVNKTKFWCITALRVPLKKFEHKRKIKHFYTNINIGFLSKRALRYNKRLVFVQKHYKKHKQIFNFTRIRNKMLVKSKVWSKSVKTLLTRKTFNRNKKNNKVLWLVFLANLNQSVFFFNKKQTRYYIKDTFESTAFLHFLQTFKGTLDWPTRNWVLKPRRELRPAVTSCINKNIFDFKTFYSLNKKKNLLVFRNKKIVKVLTFLTLKRQRRFLKIQLRLWKIATFWHLKHLRKKKFARKNSQVAFFELLENVKYKAKKVRLRKALEKIKKQNVLANNFRFVKNFAPNNKKKKVKDFYRNNLQKIAFVKPTQLRGYLLWRSIYIKKLLAKQIYVRKFLKLIKKLKNGFNKIKPKYKLLFLKKKKVDYKKKNELAIVKNRIKNLLDRRLNSKLKKFFNELSRPYDRNKKNKTPKIRILMPRFLATNMTVELAPAWVETHWKLLNKAKMAKAFSFAHKTKKLKKNLSTKYVKMHSFRINFLFKKIVKRLFQPRSSASLLVKFLQPDGVLFSIKKLKSMVSQVIDVSKTKRKKLYKRMLPILLALFRYYHPQALVEQIAFELEKTKKHWNVLRQIQAWLDNFVSSIFLGYRILIRGKVNSSDRTRKYIIKQGKEVPMSTFNSSMLYAYWTSLARTGCFGIRGWIYFPPSQKNNN